MASCVRNICTKNYQNLVIGFQVTVKNVGDVFLGHSVDFDGPSLDFLDSMKPAHESIKERYPRKSRCFTVVGQYFMKTVADRHGHAA